MLYSRLNKLLSKSLLIYPYWNVNKAGDCVLYRYSDAFNLSILECKYKMAPLWFAKFPLLIYPYWNVNAIQMAIDSGGAFF